MLKFFAKYDGAQLISLKIILLGHEPIPVDCIEITNEQFNELLPQLDNLIVQKSIAKQLIDQKAGEVRLRFITSVPGQAETYIMKANEAKLLKSIDYSVTTDILQATYPVINAEVLATSQPLALVCETVIATENAWKQIAGVIERERRQGKIAIDNSDDISELQVELQTAITSLNSIT